MPTNLNTLNTHLLLMPFCALIAVVLDRHFGEPTRWHPLVGFGHLANRLAESFNPNQRPAGRLMGLIAWGGLVLIPVFVVSVLQNMLPSGVSLLLDIGLMYFALGARSLQEHGEAIAEPLLAGDLPQARQRLSGIVSRDTQALDESGVAKGAVESLLENGNDAIFGALFWFALLGGPGALLFRLANTLDAMWGYRTPRWLQFGWAAARIDDLLNYLPARLTALTYALLGNTQKALNCWRTQAPTWDSPNAGPVMAAGAGALDLQLGGAAVYHGTIEERPTLGAGHAPSASDIPRVLTLLRQSMTFWLLTFVLWGIVASLTLGSLPHA